MSTPNLYSIRKLEPVGPEIFIEHHGVAGAVSHFKEVKGGSVVASNAHQVDANGHMIITFELSDGSRWEARRTNFKLPVQRPETVGPRLRLVHKED